MGDDKAVDDKYNVEAAEIIANEAQVSYWYHKFGYFIEFYYPFDGGYWILQFCMRLCLSLQRLPIAEAAAVYEQLLALFPTAVSSSNSLYVCIIVSFQCYILFACLSL
jgi:hypothetical protein